MDDVGYEFSELVVESRGRTEAIANPPRYILGYTRLL